jgi:hypothetical protein
MSKLRRGMVPGEERRASMGGSIKGFRRRTNLPLTAGSAKTVIRLDR